MLTIREITDKSTWEAFVENYPTKTFLHSWNWAEFNQQIEDEVVRLGLYEGEAEQNPSESEAPAKTEKGKKLVGAALIIKVRARRGSFLFCPHGPLLNWSKKDHFKALVEYLKKLAREEKFDFIRISPLILNNEENKATFKKQGFRPAPMHMHAEVTWTLDLGPSEEELLKNMRKNTRYYVRRAEKDGVTVEISKDLKDVEAFNKLYSETKDRHNFVPFSLNYLQKQFKSFSNDDQIAVFKALYNNKVVASSIIVFYADGAYYHHGASTHKYPKIPAPYLIKWEEICEAKRRGKKIYNFWGIAPTDDKKHPFHGITTFKTGFGGERTDYLHAQDLAVTWKYWLNWLVESFRRIKRGF